MKGQFGRGRAKSQGHRCPACNRILLPKRGLWPPHYSRGKEHLRVWCNWSDQPYPQEVRA